MTTPPMTAPVICIDGPSGSGKGTVARNLARKLGFHYLDSGALYRILAVLSLRQGVDASDASALAKIASGISVRFQDDQVLMDGEDLSPDVRLETTAAVASELAAHKEVRKALVSAQRAYAIAPGLIADGRDMGTEIFPQAPLKVFLTASAEERARRRMDQLEELAQNGSNKQPQTPVNKGLNAAERGDRLRALVKDIESRDERDRTRETSPLCPANDAVQIDSTSMSVDEVLQEVLELWKQAE